MEMVVCVYIDGYGNGQVKQYTRQINKELQLIQK